MLNGDCLMLIFKAVKSNLYDATTSTPHQVYGRNRELAKLRRVRRGWKDLIDSQPYLWNSIVLILGDRASVESANLFLRHSRTATIHLYGHGTSSPLDKCTRKLVNGMKKQLEAISGRIISFHITKPDPRLLRVWPVNAPNLKELVIESASAFPAVFHGEMPLLRSIITPVRNDNRYLMTQNITSLTLHPPYTLNELLTTLDNTPMLRSLELQSIFAFSRDDSLRVSLPHLEDLFLSYCCHEVISFINLPERTCITVTIPEHIERGISWQDTDIVSPIFIPPQFLRSSTLAISTDEVPGPTAVRFVGQNTTNMGLCHVYIDFNEDSDVEHRHGACVYAMGMVKNLTSVSSLRFDAQVGFPTKCMPWIERFCDLRVLTLTGPCMYPILLDLVSAELNAVPSLQRLVLDQTFTPIYRKFKDWIVAREEGGFKVVDCLIPVEVDN